MEKLIKERLDKVLLDHMGPALLQKAKNGEKVFFDLGDAGRPADPAQYCDSLDRVELIMAIEDEFEISIPDVDAVDLKSLEVIESYLIKHLV